MKNLHRDHLISFSAGCAAAFASIFAKLAFSNFISEYVNNEMVIMCLVSLIVQKNLADGCNFQMVYFFRAISFGAMFVSNSVMLTFFTKAMHSSTSFRATVATTSFNFSVSVCHFDSLIF